MTENRMFTLCRMITWVVFLRMIWNFISSLPVKRGGSLSFLVRTISNVLVMEIGWTDVGSRGYISVSFAHSNTSYSVCCNSLIIVQPPNYLDYNCLTFSSEFLFYFIQTSSLATSQGFQHFSIFNNSIFNFNLLCKPQL